KNNKNDSNSNDEIQESRTRDQEFQELMQSLISKRRLDSSLFISTELKLQYFQNRKKWFNEIKTDAIESANNALHVACEEVITKKNEILEVEFDCLWSKVREASQASAEFIYNRTPKEHANLIKIIGKIILTLYEYNITLNIGDDGDLNTNKTLCEEKIPIMNFYTKSIYTAAAQMQNPDIISPTDNDLYIMQSEICVDHLLDNHNNCWAEICWKVQNFELFLANSNLIGYTES
ncbi:16046_t:CDS:2, partial [Dentiscutata heterogama]